MIRTRFFTAAALGLAGTALLAGCATTDAAGVPVKDGGSASVTAAAPSSALATATPTVSTAPTTPATAAPSTTPAGPAAHASGRPKPPAFVYTSTDTVRGLTAAIAAAPHPGLSVCSGSYASILVASGDLRGTGVVQYLVDTTCIGATGSTPDEVALYSAVGARLARNGVIYTATANRPTLTAQPYLSGAHTVVLTYNQGARFSLVTITPTSIVQGELLKA